MRLDVIRAELRLAGQPVGDSDGGVGLDSLCPVCGEALFVRRRDPSDEESYELWCASHCALARIADELAIRSGASASSGRTPSDHDDNALGGVPAYPITALPPAAVGLVEGSGLPKTLVAGAAIGALCAAIGARAQVEITPNWHQRAILWIALLAPRGAGKSPAQAVAVSTLRTRDAELSDDEAALLLGDTTLEALARSLAASDDAAALDLDELSMLLRGLGEYKRGGGDQSRLLSLWSGEPWSFTRVAGGQKTNGVTIRLRRPTLTIIGGLQTPLHSLLGGDADGLRPRWLPHLCDEPAGSSLSSIRAERTWPILLRDLIEHRETDRTWKLSKSARAEFEDWRSFWKEQAHGPEPAGVAGALVKADTHLARVALVLAEADAPGKGGEIDAETMRRAAAIVEFVIGCWRALPEQESGLGISRRDQVLDRAVSLLAAWVEEHDGRTTRRDIQRACVAGARKAADVDALLAEYEATYPGSVITVAPEHGGRSIVTVKAPRRSPFQSMSAVPTSSKGPSKRDGAEPRTAMSAMPTSPPPTTTADTVPVYRVDLSSTPIDQVETFITDCLSGEFGHAEEIS